MVCKYKDEVMTGDEIVPEAAPFIDGLVEAACAISKIDDLYKCGSDVLAEIQRKRACSQIIYDTQQYVQEYFIADAKTLGNYAGKLILANNECKPVTGTAKDCWAAAKDAIDSLPKDEEEEIQAPQSLPKVEDLLAFNDLV